MKKMSCQCKKQKPNKAKSQDKSKTTPKKNG